MTQGKPLAIILRFMFPLFLGNVFQQLYNMVDSIIVGNFVGKDALAGVGSTGTIMFLVNGFAIGIATGFSVLTSQRFGADDVEGTRRSVGNGIILSAIFGTVLTIVSTASMPVILHWMHTPDSIYQEAYDYIVTICAGLMATLYYNLFSSFLRAIGNSKVPLYFLIFSAGLNVVLDLAFILALGWGVKGAARATILSQGISAILCLIYIVKKVSVLKPRRKHWRLHAADSWHQMAIGIPMGLQYSITASGTMVMQSAINRFEEAIAVFTAASKIQNLMMQGMISIGQTMATYAGQNYGSKNIKRVHQGTIDALKFVIAYAIVSGLIMIIMIPRMLHLFFPAGTDIQALLPWARIYVYECVVCYIPLGMIFIYRNTIQGCGYGVAAMSMGFIELFARISTAVLSVNVGSYALAVGCDPAAWLARGVYGFILYLFVRKKIQRDFSA